MLDLYEAAVIGKGKTKGSWNRGNGRNWFCMWVSRTGI